MIDSLTANRIGAVRRQKLQGRDFLVAPVRMIVPGVLSGSQGALLYPADEVRKNVQAWNGMPITVGHPKQEGGFVSARQPQVLNETAIGSVFNARIEDSNLDAEAWIDIERARQVDAGIVSRIENHQALSISTGLLTRKVGASGSYNGRPYTGIARNYQPDHLAILPSGGGACSIEDGCGLLVNGESLGDFIKRKAAESERAVMNTQKIEALPMPGADYMTANESAEPPAKKRCGCQQKQPKPTANQALALPLPGNAWEVE